MSSFFVLFRIIIIFFIVIFIFFSYMLRTFSPTSTIRFALNSRGGAIISSTITKRIENPLIFISPRFNSDTSSDVNERLASGKKKASEQQQDWSGVRTTGQKLRRVYKNVGVRKQENGDLYEITLDGKAVVTPTKKKLLVPTEDIAKLIALEWAMQGHEIRHSSMLMTTLAATAIDDVEPNHVKYCREVLKFLETDSVCVREGRHEKLEKSQSKYWDPLVDFVEKRFGLRPHVTKELVKVEQNHDLMNLFEDYLNETDIFTLAAVHSIASTAKSLIIPMALVEGKMNAREATEAALVEELYQIEENGLVEGYHDLFLAKTRAKIAGASLFLHYLRVAKIKNTNPK
eukprot:c20165_g1_i1.p1 GENE.c20165_g1_i1~~c20165_g1_i1.p1  ORF type:complete len:345 (-),score=119.66 c20165_g1_i1:47-1081(-)